MTDAAREEWDERHGIRARADDRAEAREEWEQANGESVGADAREEAREEWNEQERKDEQARIRAFVDILLRRRLHTKGDGAQRLIRSVCKSPAFAEPNEPEPNPKIVIGSTKSGKSVFLLSLLHSVDFDVTILDPIPDPEGVNSNECALCRINKIRKDSLAD